MVLNINFKGNTDAFTKPLNKEVNGFINTCLGNGNKYHGNFSRYCISSMQGGHMDKNGTITFPNGGYIQVSSDDEEFLTNLVNGLMMNFNEGLCVATLKYKSFDVKAVEPYNEYDIIRTISPLYISKNSKSLTYKDDNFIEVLTDKSRKKLIHCGVSERIANTLNFKLFHSENAKTKMIECGKQKNICNQVMLYVTGDKRARLKIYELGLGKCTGFGFGAVTIIRKTN